MHCQKVGLGTAGVIACKSTIIVTRLIRVICFYNRENQTLASGKKSKLRYYAQRR
jgi:hypothetical protein